MNPTVFDSTEPSVFTSAEPSSNDSTSPSIFQSAEPSALVSIEPSANDSNSPSLNQSSEPSANNSNVPTTSSSGVVKVSYFDATGWDFLPSSGLANLSPYKTDTVDTINFPHTLGALATSGRSEYVGALFEGYLNFDSDGEQVKLCLTSDDGSKLMIDGSLVIDNDGLHDDRTRCAVVELSGLLKIDVEFFEWKGGITCILQWERPPGSSRVAIPASAWR